jgi:hypothetical protein
MTSDEYRKENTMSEPFIFITTSKIKEGRLDEYRTYTRKSVEIIHANEPRLIAFSTYINEAGTKATTVQVHPDVESMMFHMQVMRERMDIAFENLELESMTICGKINDQFLEMAKQFATSGVSLNINPEALGGFTRFMAD